MTTSISSHDSDQSIINRKRECRGIPGSFSANLGLRKSPSRGIGARDATPPKSGGNTSVKAIVAWLESSKDESRSVTSVSSDSRSKSSFTTASLSTKPASIIHQQSLPMAPDVEEYSLTLLKYREYFTERPLARCLDEKKIEATTYSVKHTPDDSPHCPLNAGEKKNAVADRNTNKVSATETRTSPDAPQPATRSCGECGVSRSHRDIHAFWEDVRSFLWIPNEELEEIEVTKAVQLKPKISLRKTPVMGLPNNHEGADVDDAKKKSSSHRKVRSAPSLPAGFVRGRKRFLSVEEKMLEIDAFLGTD